MASKAESPGGGAAAPGPLFHLGYVSTQTRPLSRDEILAMLTHVREHNHACGVTGVLLHREGSFFQVLEGVEEDVRNIFARVTHDTRHERIEVPFEESIEEREFPDWRMGFVELDGVDMSKLEGTSDFLTRSTDPRELFTRLTRAKRLMLLFRQMN
jgi:hypothetical protein